MFKRKTDQRQVGIYWGKDSFCLVEAFNKIAEKFGYTPFDAPLPTTDADQSPIPEELKFPALLKNSLGRQSIHGTKVNLTLSTKDFIFRSFVIPWMPDSEAKNVVSFEATKYIPIPLEDLIYTYHALAFTENNQKQIRVLFFAARKDLLNRYAGYFEQAGLQINHIEPEPVSLVRLLTRFGHIRRQDSTAIITLNKGEGKIFIIAEEIVQFVREFQMPEDFDDPALLRIKLFNEVRISFSFYVRQNSLGKIEQILLLSTMPFPELDKDITQEFGKPSKLIAVHDFIKTPASTITPNIGLLSAFGNALWLPGAVDFELAEKAKALRRADEAIQGKFKQYLKAAGVVAVCAGICALAVVISNVIQDNQKKRIAQLSAQEGNYKNLTIADLEKLDTDTRTKLTAYKDVRLKSSINFYMQKVPKLLPQEAWLKSFDVRYENQTGPGGVLLSSALITLYGYVYIPDANDQFRFVVGMVETLKQDTDFSKAFKEISLDSMNQEVVAQNVVINFKITCK